MSSSAGSSVRLLCALLTLACLCGCAGVEPRPAPLPGNVSPLVVDFVAVGPPAPQAAGTVTIRWAAVAQGGSGERSYDFFLREGGGREERVQTGEERIWGWRPNRPGAYQVRVVVRDSLGSEARSDWSEPYEIAPPLKVEAPMPDRRAPQAAGTAAIHWTAQVTGGVGERVYDFRLQESDGSDRSLQIGPGAFLLWTPAAAGTYRVRAVVTDRLGNRAEGPWSEPYDVAPRLRVESLSPDRPTPRMATTEIRWRAEATGGVGARGYAFEVARGDGAAKVAQRGASPEWSWQPDQAGTYRVRVVATDALRNRAESEWVSFEVAPVLRLEPAKPDREAPQAARTSPIRWEAKASGGVGRLVYEFSLRDAAGRETLIRRAPVAIWEWRPQEAGRYEVKVAVSDVLGNRVEGDWSKPYEVVPPLSVDALAPDLMSPRMAGAAIRWEARASGGVGDRVYEFSLQESDGSDRSIQTGPNAFLFWKPAASGTYKFRVRVRDRLENEVQSAWSEPYEIAAMLRVGSPRPDVPSPQAAGTVEVRWSAEAVGGVGARSYEFLLADPDGREAVVQTGPELAWTWKPSESGTYRVRIRARDFLGNEALSAWSQAYEVSPPLRVGAPTADRSPPQAAVTTVIRWEAKATGGVGEGVYEFRLQEADGSERSLQSGPGAFWLWTPAKAGIYRVRVVATDQRGNRVEGPWSEPYEVLPRLLVEALTPDRLSPQMTTTPVVWSAAASGGVGARIFGFELARGDGPPDLAQQGPKASWTWSPRQSGAYRVRATVRDSLGNSAAGEWIPYEIAAVLRVEPPKPDKPAPQAAVTTTIRWAVQAVGGVPPLRYEFQLAEGEGEAQGAQAGPDSSWSWVPKKAGLYKVRVVVSDHRGNRVTGAFSAEYEVVPPVAIAALKPDKPAPQMAGTSVLWSLEAGGGVGTLTYQFFVKPPGAEETLLQAGPNPSWSWKPAAAGTHQVRVRVVDTLGNAAEKTWPGGYVVAPELKVLALTPNLPPPQVSYSPVLWQARAEGGVKPLTYEFQTRWKRGRARTGQRGAQDSWEWRPVAAGSHEVRVKVADSRGNAVESPWSAPYGVELPRIAVLPFQNLSGDPVPLKKLRDLFAARLGTAGLSVVEEKKVEDLMAALRMRFTGGFEEPLAKAFRKELGAHAVLVTSIEAFEQDRGPRLSILSRLVSTEDSPTVLWSDRVARRGDESPGILGLGLVSDPAVLQDRAVGQLLGSLLAHLTEGVEHRPEASAEDGRLQPRRSFRSPSLSGKPEYTVAVLPFFNWTLRRNAGELLALHFVNQLANRSQFTVIEPGVVRHRLLNFRFVMDQGISLSDVDTVGNSLGADLVVTGTVREYEEPASAGGEPKVDVSVQLTAVAAKKVVWSSRSYAEGREGVYFYDWRAFDTASEMVAGMVGAIADEAVGESGGEGEKGSEGSDGLSSQ